MDGEGSMWECSASCLRPGPPVPEAPLQLQALSHPTVGALWHGRWHPSVVLAMKADKALIMDAATLNQEVVEASLLRQGQDWIVGPDAMSGYWAPRELPPALAQLCNSLMRTTPGQAISSGGDLRRVYIGIKHRHDCPEGTQPGPVPPTPNGWPRNELWGGKDTRKDTFGWTFLQAVAARMRDLTRHHSVNKPYTEGDITFPEPVWVQVVAHLGLTTKDEEQMQQVVMATF